MKDNKKVNIGVTGFGGSKLVDALLSKGLNLLTTVLGRNTKNTESDIKAYIATNIDAIGRQHYIINHRALERNKYAPWGRGLRGGRPV